MEGAHFEQLALHFCHPTHDCRCSWVVSLGSCRLLLRAEVGWGCEMNTGFTRVGVDVRGGRGGHAWRGHPG